MPQQQPQKRRSRRAKRKAKRRHKGDGKCPNVSMSPYYNSHQTSTTTHSTQPKVRYNGLCMCPAHPVHNSSELILCVDNALSMWTFFLSLFLWFFFCFLLLNGTNRPAPFDVVWPSLFWCWWYACCMHVRTRTYNDDELVHLAGPSYPYNGQKNRNRSAILAAFSYSAFWLGHTVLVSVAAWQIWPVTAAVFNTRSTHTHTPNGKRTNVYISERALGVGRIANWKIIKDADKSFK